MDKDPKRLKLAFLNVLRILQEESSPANTMTAKDVQRRLLERYEIKLDIKTVRDYLELLNEDEESHIACRQKESITDSGKQPRRYDWHCTKSPLFNRSEYLYIAAGIASSSKISRQKKRRLIEKLKPYCGGFIPPALRDLYNTSASEITNDQFFENIRLIDEALQNRYCLTFHLCEHDSSTGALIYERGQQPYTIEPEFIAVWNGLYHLVANYPNKKPASIFESI